MKTLLFTLFCAAFATGCSIQGELTDLTKITTNSNLVTGGEFVSAGDVFEVDGYTVHSTLGGFNGATKDEVGGYTIYSNVVATSVSDLSTEIRE
jgi:hypothetical protein